ncbi:MAG TPA: hypothetical protein VE866_11715 [Candidatus Binatia bacterium]|nr:hypothetical protein [Candidatus Binatia bacterium]
MSKGAMSGWKLEARDSRLGTRDYVAFKRPAPAVWGNGLWGSVGGAGRSYD